MGQGQGIGRLLTAPAARAAAVCERVTRPGCAAAAWARAAVPEDALSGVVDGSAGMDVVAVGTQWMQR